MRRALDLASRGCGSVSPNPPVGAVLVKGGRILAEGFHHRFGHPHAERNLFASLPRTGIPRGAVLYLTLEPCTYEGKTPACVDLLLDSPIRRFVIAMRDPNPKVRGRGIRRLVADGRDVRVGLLQEEAERLAAPFSLSQKAGRARVTLKMAVTLDGRLADAQGRSRWLSGPVSRTAVGSLRGLADAIVVGRGTVVADDPRLRSEGPPERAVSRIVLSSSLDFDPACRLARIWRRETAYRGAPDGALRAGNWAGLPAGGRTRWVRAPRLIVATGESSGRRIRRFREFGWEIWRLPEAARGVDLTRFAQHAAAEGLIDLLVEPGPTLSASFLDAGPADRILFFIAPMILGGGMGWADRLAPLPLAKAIRTAFAGVAAPRGKDMFVVVEGPRGRPIVPARGPRNAVHSR
jgi:diaminohydroxyphosphoribosylaminopyrimidine deaminase/5-amino-6-(5-phosphoribosylamino)uracil reductase